MAIETGLSDFHKMTVTVMKSHKKLKPKIIYRKYTNFSTDLFREMLMRNINKQNFPNITLDSLKYIFINILDTLAPVKHKYVRANQAPFMTKTLNKAVMDRSRIIYVKGCRLKNSYLKNKTPGN